MPSRDADEDGWSNFNVDGISEYNNNALAR